MKIAARTAFPFQISFLLLAAATVLNGCGTSGGSRIASDFDAASGGTTLDDYKQQLREIIRAEIAETRRDADVSDADLHNYKPYYFKAFEDYPAGPDSFEIEFIEQDSKTAPLVANVTIPKLRFTTDVQRDRTEARVDDDFKRQRGLETISFELRNGRWHRLASLFVATDVSTMSGGEWVPLEEEPRDEFDRFEDRPGWFRRTLDRLRIGEDPGTPTQ